MVLVGVKDGVMEFFGVPVIVFDEIWVKVKLAIGVTVVKNGGLSVPETGIELREIVGVSVALGMGDNKMEFSVARRISISNEECPLSSKIFFIISNCTTGIIE